MPKRTLPARLLDKAVHASAEIVAGGYIAWLIGRSLVRNLLGIEDDDEC